MKHHEKLKYAEQFRVNILKTWNADTSKDYIIHVGKTNSGKTYNSIKRLVEYGDGIYLAPLRLLAWEVFDKINGDDKFICNLITGEEQISSPHAKITSATIEMADFNKEYEVAVIDESFMIGDKDRGKSWLNAILNIKAKEVHVITNEEALEVITSILDLTDRGYEVKKYEMLQQFKFTDKPFILSKNIPKKGVFATFSRMEVLINKAKLESLGFNVSILYGNLPPEVKKIQIADFIEGKTDLLVTTDVIGMGINVPCDYIIFMESSKFDGTQTRRLTPIEVKQISGRTGRYGLSNGNCFVSAINKNDLKYIKSAYGLNSKIDKAYFGLTWEIFSSFSDNTSLLNRINYFKDIDFIPLRLKNLIKKEDVQKYLDIHHTIDSQSNLDLKTKWYFLTSPIKNNNSNYFNKCIAAYNKNGILSPPDVNVINYSESKQFEDKISEIELYLNLSRHLIHDSKEKQKITDDKKELIDRLTKMIMDKKLSSKKKCKLCTNMLPITYPYGYCEDCYENKVRRQYDYDYNF